MLAPTDPAALEMALERAAARRRQVAFAPLPAPAPPPPPHLDRETYNGPAAREQPRIDNARSHFRPCGPAAERAAE